ncbi:hypothetical protein NLG97_g7296 [Lecanicillium saksenae]|uniref:Uncharacterized protein n=1 Tax=Lecanicillium saksenae TaxID=468837 RepID=A0ACC1QNW1_9HYPO|nr:hypothetical protein NLG97_g7296 [Lecanicillium saksenae]
MRLLHILAWLAAAGLATVSPSSKPFTRVVDDKWYQTFRKNCAARHPTPTPEPEIESVFPVINGTMRLGYNGIGTEEIRPIPHVNKMRLTCGVEVGWPPQNFSLMISTGSATTWVIGNETIPINYNLLNNRTYYRPWNSTSGNGTVTANYSFAELYTDGMDVEGVIYRERVRVGKYDGIELQDQYVGVAKRVHASLTNQSYFEGVFGLGKTQASGIEPFKLPSFTDTNRSLRKKNTFSLTLKLYGGHIDFGYLNHSRYSGELFRVSLDPDHNTAYHVFKASGYAIGTKPMRIQDFRVAPETASSFILLSEDMADEYYGEFAPDVEKVDLPGSNTGYIYRCDVVLPDFTLQFVSDTGARKRFTVPGKDLRYEEVREGMCLGNIMALPPPKSNIAVLGWPFLQNKFLHFELDTHIGFANAAEGLE